MSWKIHNGNTDYTGQGTFHANLNANVQLKSSCLGKKPLKFRSSCRSLFFNFNTQRGYEACCLFLVNSRKHGSYRLRWSAMQTWTERETSSWNPAVWAKSRRNTPKITTNEKAESQQSHDKRKRPKLSHICSSNAETTGLVIALPSLVVLNTVIKLKRVQVLLIPADRKTQTKSEMTILKKTRCHNGHGKIT